MIKKTVEAALQLMNTTTANKNSGPLEVTSLLNPGDNHIDSQEIDVVLRNAEALKLGLRDDLFDLTVWQARQWGSGDHFEEKLAKIAESKVTSLDWQPELPCMFCEHCVEVHEFPKLQIAGHIYQVCLIHLKVL